MIRRLVLRIAVFCLVALVPASATVAGAPEAAAPAPWVDSEREALRLIEADPPDWTGAHEAFGQAATLGSIRAQSYLGWMYEHGHGVEANAHEAARRYAEVARAGGHEFALKLGWMYLGTTLGPDREQAEHWFGQAIEAGYLPANVALASLLVADALGGVGVERVGEARGLLEYALARGERLAAFFLARLYVEGIGGHPVEPVLAARYTRLAAEDGHAQMQGWLALMHLKGDGVAVDRLEAAFWAALAAGAGDPLGRELHRVLAAELSEPERKAVMERTLLWALDQPERG